MLDNSEFYPTPRPVIEKMIEPYKGRIWRGGINGDYVPAYGELDDKIILEPSAGKGDILDYITGRYKIGQRYSFSNEYPEYTKESVKSKQIYCCEQDPNLKHILQDKGYRVIADDFLEYNGDYYFDLILMNPPFSNGDEHLLKAWEIMHDGDIVCLLNAETLKNPYTKRRKLLADIVDKYGSWEELGNVFSDAERKTDVNVALVRLKKANAKTKLDFDFSGINKEKDFHISEETFKDAPALKDIVGNMLIQYDKIKEGFVEYMKLASLLDHYGAPLVVKDEDGKESNGISIFTVAQNAFKEGKNRKESFNLFCESMKHHMWRIVMGNINNIASFDMEKFMTHKVRQNFSEYLSRQGAMDFTRENVWNMITMLHDNKHNILEDAVVEVFDIFTSYHKENRLHVEGWKTNDKWKVNKKIILPRAVRWGIWSKASDLKMYGGEFDLHYESSSKYSDIDKVMDYLTGKKAEERVGLYESLITRFRRIGKVYPGDEFTSMDSNGESYYFKWKFFKKGTLHIEFKDEKLWEQFNLRACAGKHWLPEKEQRAYEEAKRKASQPQPKPEPKPLLQLAEATIQEEFVDL